MVDNRCIKRSDLNEKMKYSPLIGSYVLKDDINSMKELFYIIEAKWLHIRRREFRCSNCGQKSNSKPYRGREKHCPGCGAKMTNT